MDPEEPNELDGKTGKDLFLELFRLLPSSQVEDYYIHGRWNEDDIKLDWELLQAHRREAGAEDPPSLEELELPALPDNKAFGALTQFTRPTPVGTGGYPTPASVTAATPLRPMPVKTAPTSAMVAASVGVAGGGPSAELRQIALFIAKWKLEATKTKLLLARLTPPRRRWVMQHFAQSGTLQSATVQLEQYIARCERENLWAGATPTASSTASALKPASGLKRPLTPTPVSDPNKRPKIGGVTPLTPARTGFAGTGLRPAGALASRPSPAWLSAAGGSGRIAPAKPAFPKPAAARPVGLVSGIRAQSMPARATYGGVGLARPGLAAPKLGMIRPAGAFRPPVAKPGGRGPAAKPGSLIANLLRM